MPHASAIDWPTVRHVITFTLGCLVILDGITSSGNPWPELGIGAIMVGILPLDRVVVGMRPDQGGRGGRPRPRPHRNEDDE